MGKNTASRHSHPLTGPSQCNGDSQIHHLTCGGGFFGTYNMCTGSSPRQSGVIDRPPVDDCVGVGGVVKPIWVVLRLRSKTPQGEMAWLGLGDLAESPSSDD